MKTKPNIYKKITDIKKQAKKTLNQIFFSLDNNEENKKEKQIRNK